MQQPKLLKTCCFGCRKVKRGFILFLFFSWVVVGYNLERLWAGWKQFVRRQGCAFGKKTSSSPCSPEEPSLALCFSNEHHSSVIKSNSHVFLLLLLYSIRLFLVRSILFLPYLSIVLPFTQNLLRLLTSYPVYRILLHGSTFALGCFSISYSTQKRTLYRFLAFLAKLYSSRILYPIRYHTSITRKSKPKKS